MQKKVLIAADVDPSFVARIGADPRFSVRQELTLTEDALALAIGESEVLVTRAANRVSRLVIEAAPRLELLAQGTSGIDNIDAAAAAERGVAIVHLPGSNANAVAELVLGLMLALTRTVPAYSRGMSSSRWERADCATRHELRHHRLGIVGLGHVGRRVAKLAGAFGVEVTAFDPYLTVDDFAQRGAAAALSLADLLASVDIVTLHVPLTAETRAMVGPAEIARMPRGSYLINTARGEVLDLPAALEALRTHHLAGLAVDVFDPEPPVDPFPDDPRLILTPHVAGCTAEAKSAIGAGLYDRIVEHYGWK